MDIHRFSAGKYRLPATRGSMEARRWEEIMSMWPLSPPSDLVSIPSFEGASTSERAATEITSRFNRHSCFQLNRFQRQFFGDCNDPGPRLCFR